jgi:hypothetical protein
MISFEGEQVEIKGETATFLRRDSCAHLLPFLDRKFTAAVTPSLPGG